MLWYMSILREACIASIFGGFPLLQTGRRQNRSYPLAICGEQNPSNANPILAGMIMNQVIVYGLSTVENADQIVECRIYRELLTKSGAYCRLHESWYTIIRTAKGNLDLDYRAPLGRNRLGDYQANWGRLERGITNSGESIVPKINFQKGCGYRYLDPIHLWLRAKLLLVLSPMEEQEREPWSNNTRLWDFIRVRLRHGCLHAAAAQRVRVRFRIRYSLSVMGMMEPWRLVSRPKFMSLTKAQSCRSLEDRSAQRKGR